MTSPHSQDELLQVRFLSYLIASASSVVASGRKTVDLPDPRGCSHERLHLHALEVILNGIKPVRIDDVMTVASIRGETRAFTDTVHARNWLDTR